MANNGNHAVGYVLTGIAGLVIGAVSPTVGGWVWERVTTPHYAAGEHKAYSTDLDLDKGRVYIVGDKNCMYDDGGVLRQTKGLNIDGSKTWTGELCFAPGPDYLKSHCAEVVKCPDVPKVPVKQNP